MRRWRLRTRTASSEQCLLGEVAEAEAVSKLSSPTAHHILDCVQALRVVAVSIVFGKKTSAASPWAARLREAVVPPRHNCSLVSKPTVPAVMG